MDGGAADRVREHLTLNPPRKVLLLVHPNIGDTVNLTAVARWVKQAWPRAFVVGCTAQIPSPLFEACPFVDEVWLRPDTVFGQASFLARVRRAGFDLSLHCQGQNTLLRLVKAAGVPVRVGVAGSKHAEALHVSVRWKVGEVEQPGTMGRLLSALGCDCSDSSPAVEVGSEARSKAAGLLGEGRFMAVMPGASHPAKTWPLERFREVVAVLPHDVVPVWLGGPAEVGRAGEAAEGRAIDLTGKLSVIETMAVLERSRLLLTNDSGPMHLAAAVGTPVVALFGPTSSKRFAPYGEGHAALQGRCECPVRDLDRCGGACLNSIGVSDVVPLVLAALKP
ncbi:MAG: glycosyltransferase family 9 protein [Armatimonadetes bacterium]|nr:glycosyltransferase family 9 protein [Armatimonadota bacterium]